jgi:hypothetical protein
MNTIPPPSNFMVSHSFNDTHSYRNFVSATPNVLISYDSDSGILFWDNQNLPASGTISNYDPKRSIRFL